MNKGKFYLTTAITYASRKPHIGNTYEIILADAIARYKRLCGYDVFLLTGTDEHGQKIESCAREKGVSPREYVDDVAGQIKDIWESVGSTHNKFIRTTDSQHERAVSRIFTKLYEQGDIYKSEYEGWYCTPCESFFTETQVTDGKCPDCSMPLTRTKEEAYFLAMSKYQDRLLKHIEQNPDFIVPPSRKKEMVNNFLKSGLLDLCVSRSSFKWGVPVEFDDGHIIYVWVDALSNYITALGYDVDEKGELFKKYWPCDLHIIGKDILRFHTIYWPIILMALGEELPKQVFGHPWLLFGSDKMSKSKGNVVYALDLIRHFGADGCRYYVLAEMPYANDGTITYENVIARYNSDLANNLGNLTKRTVAMTCKYFGAAVPSPDAPADIDDELRRCVADARDRYFTLMDEYRIAEAAEVVFGMLRRANKYIDETMPWVLARDEEQRPRLGTVLYNLLETIRTGAVLLQPIIPFACEKIFAMLGSCASSFESIAEFGALKSGAEVTDGEALFVRADEEKTLAALREEKKAAEVPPVPKPEAVSEIDIDIFAQTELRCAQIIECEPVPKSDKLLKLMLDLGYEKRQVVSGIAKFYTPEQLIGKKVIVAANLKSVKLRGVDSHGMILASGEDVVRVVFLHPDTPPGERIR